MSVSLNFRFTEFENFGTWEFRNAGYIPVLKVYADQLDLKYKHRLNMGIVPCTGTCESTSHIAF